MARGEDAVSGAYQFSVGGGILIILISTGLSATQELGADPSSNRAALEDVRSEALLSVALSSSWSWSEGGAATESGFAALDGGLKMEAMTMFKGAQWNGAPNEVIDYDEAQQQWGLEPSEDFHLRIVPIDSTTIYDLSGLRVAYVAAWQDIGEIHADFGTGQNMMAEVRAQVDGSMDAVSQEERAILTSLGVDYDDDVRITAAFPAVVADVTVGQHVFSFPLAELLSDVTIMEGDVYLADRDYLHGSISGHWDEYDVVVIGSGAASQALAQGDFASHARQHVEGGGLLVLLGGTEDSAWMEDAFEDAQETANQQRQTPDLSHPLLTWPAPANWQDLEEGPALAAATAPDASWQHILGNSTHVDLAVSQQGAIGDGMAILSTLQPEGPAGEQLVLNMLAYYARQDLHLDFGKTLPPDVSVAGSERLMWGTDAGDNQVALRVQLLYWGR